MQQQQVLFEIQIKKEIKMKPTQRNFQCDVT